MATLLSILCVAGSYLLGSLSAGLWFASQAGIDLRAIGSGNIGATNVGRALGRRAELWVLVLDAAKGALAAALLGAVLSRLGSSALLSCSAGIAAVVGHCFPFYAPTQGGKGVATSLGAILAWSLSTAGVAILIYVAVRRLSRLPSLAALVATTAALVASVWLSPLYTLPIGILAALITLRHEDNLLRLMHGTEPKHPPVTNLRVDPKDRA